MSIIYPAFLWLLIPLIIVLWQNRYSFTNQIHLIILILITLSLSRPSIKGSPQKIDIEGQDIIIALDISYSMNATDIKPTRYEFAKETINYILKTHVNDNIMLIAFTSNPLILSPPTTDHQLIEIALKSLNREFILTKGTSLKNLFNQIVSMDIGHQNLILITDGGEESDINSLKDILQKSGISLSILAMGSKKGTTIKDRYNKLLKDENGDLVISRINPILKHLTSNYFTVSNSPQSTADEIYKSLDNKKKKSQKMQYSYLELYQIPLLLAIILFFMVHTKWIEYLRNYKKDNNEYNN